MHARPKQMLNRAVMELGWSVISFCLLQHQFKINKQ